MTERLHFHFSLSCIGEGNGNPLQCSCLENPRDGGAWWAAVSGVTQSWTRLKWLSSCLKCRKSWLDSWVRKIYWRRDRLPTSVLLGFPSGSAAKESAHNAGDLGSIPGSGRSPQKRNGYPFQYSGLDNSMDYSPWGSQRVRHDWATFTLILVCSITVCSVTQNSKSETQDLDSWCLHGKKKDKSSSYFMMLKLILTMWGKKQK